MKSKQVVYCILVTALLLCSVNAEASKLMRNGILRVSLINLIASPDKYHHKKIQVEGIAHVRFEDSSLYLTRGDANYLNTANAVWFKYGDNISESSRCDDKWVLIEGVFNAKDNGHMGLFVGAVEDIQRIEPYEREVKIAPESPVKTPRTAQSGGVKARGGEKQDFSDMDSKAAKINKVDTYLGTPSGSVKRFDHETSETSETDSAPTEK